jgi:tetratricopeptide (TPR) repeat protein
LTDPVDIFELVGATAVRRRLHATATHGLTRFVGRQTEIEALGQALERADSGHGQVVTVVGEPGVGKSCLFYEFLRSHHTQGWLVLESASVSYGKATPYFPVLDLMKRYCHVEDSDDPRTVRAKVTGQVLTLDAALQNTVPVLLALLDVLPADDPFLQSDPSQRRRCTLDALKRVLLRESQVQPLLLVFEDLHWIDAETQALLDSLVESLPTTRVCLLTNYRPEYQHDWGNKTYYTQLRLDPLPPESAEEFLQGLIGESPALEPLLHFLIARTAGNPFFLEESVRTLIETGALVGERGAYHLMQALPTIQVPATVQAVLAARIDRLPPEAKHVLQTAAVIGTEVPLPLLQAITELPEAALYDGLRHLQATEFVYETHLFPEHAYTFKHALTHEVAYGSLLQERRRALHARIVEALETLAADRLADHIDRLAVHAMRGEIWDKALLYCRQAGDKALAQSAYHEAVGYFEQALSALPHLPETRVTCAQAIDLRLALRTALLPFGDWGQQLGYLREAEALAEALADARRLGQVLVLLSLYFRNTGMDDQALAASERAQALATASGDRVLHALANQYLGQTYHDQGAYQQAIACFAQTVTTLAGARRRERFGQVNLPAVASRTWLAWCYAEMGRFTEGDAVGEEGLKLAEAVAHPSSLLYACWGLGVLALRQGDLSRALPVLERAMGLCQEMAPGARRPANFLRLAGDLGAAYTLAGRLADAVPLLMRAVAAQSTTAAGEASGVMRCRLFLGEAQMLAGHLEEAHARAEHALTLAHTHQRQGLRAYALRLLGEIAARRKPLERDKAAEYYLQALALADELDMRPLQAHCHVGLVTVYTTTGQREQARAALSAAIALSRAMGMTFWLPYTEAMLAQVHGSTS